MTDPSSVSVVGDRLVDRRRVRRTRDPRDGRARGLRLGLALLLAEPVRGSAPLFFATDKPEQRGGRTRRPSARS